jgi:hypothetical protein
MVLGHEGLKLTSLNVEPSEGSYFGGGRFHVGLAEVTLVTCRDDGNGDQTSAQPSVSDSPVVAPVMLTASVSDASVVAPMT